MSTEVIIALATAFTSFLVALISLISSVISNRQSSLSVEAVERLKFELSRQEATQALADRELEKGLESLQALIQQIQQFKDYLQFILQAPDRSVDSDIAIKRISALRQEFFECYEKQMTQLRADEVHASHRAKNKALEIENLIAEGLRQRQFVSALSSEEKKVLWELRNQLTDCQYLLRDNRINRLTTRLRNERRT